MDQKEVRCRETQKVNSDWTSSISTTFLSNGNEILKTYKS